MNSVLFKDVRRSVERSASRFISIIAIVALGISFFAGFNAIAPDMTQTVEKYYSDTNICDVQVMSSVGLTDTDINSIMTVSGMESARGVKFADGLLEINGAAGADIDGSQLSVRAIGLDINEAYSFQCTGTGDVSYMNRVTLLEGNWPTAPDQCLVDSSVLSTPEEFKIGATASIIGDGEDMSDVLANTQFTVVGIIRSPVYISYERGNTDVGNGKLAAYIYIPEDNFKTDYYSAIWCKIYGSESLKPYGNEYKSFVSPYVGAIQEITAANAANRAAALKVQYAGEIAAAELEYNESNTYAQTQLAEAKKNLDQIKDLAENGDAKLAEYKAQYNQLAEKANGEIGSSRLELSEEYKQWEAKMQKYNDAKALVTKYSDAENTYNTALNSYNSANVQVNGLLSTVTYLEKLVATTRNSIDALNGNQDATVGDIISRFEQSGLIGSEVDSIIGNIKSLTAMGTAEEISAYLEPELQTLEAQLASSKASLESARTALAEKKSQLDEASKLVEQLKTLEQQLTAAEQELNEAEKKLTSADYTIQFSEIETLTKLQDMKYQISTLETNVTLAKEKVKTADADYNEAVKTVNEQLENAKARLDSAKKSFEELDTAVTYVWDRDSALYGYEEYGQTIGRTKALAVVFPWFFFLVAALVCLNTMTRMVDEERVQQGTLKAMGYTDGEIASKYIIYALAASIAGSVIGCITGFCIFPYAVDKAYGILYDLPPVILKFRWGYALTGTLIAVGCTVIAAAAASYSGLRCVPAKLMRPKPPKNGKRVFLEKIGFIWQRLNFTSKVTARNVIRNKKRFIMAVAGTAGCTALMLASFGLSDSIDAALVKQYTDSDSICVYDLQTVLKHSQQSSDCIEYKAVSARPEITSSVMTGIKVFDCASDYAEKKMEAYVVVPENAAAMPGMVKLQSRRGSNSYTLDETGAVITEKLAKELSLNVGDEIRILRDAAQDVRVRVSAITENYTFHYIYMNQTVYTAVFGRNCEYNYITSVLADGVTQEQKQVLSTELVKQAGISAVSFTDDMQSMFSNIINSLNYIVLILIVCAGLLSLIVLYNLSNININERTREIATIKVLGFNDSEVSAYIFRENLVLSVVGTLIGLVAGIFLHRIMINVAEVDVVMFGRTVDWTSYLFSALLSMGFSLLVNVILFGRLKKVDMVESLKSVE